jgi:hypothetical protein
VRKLALRLEYPVKGLIIVAIVLALILLFWLGLQVKPKPFAPYQERTGQVDTVPLPGGLPAPVERFYRKIYGDQVPVIETVVITGRGTIRPIMNIPLPARFIFVHNTGRDYRHYFESTFFGQPFLKVNEGILNGASFFEAPVGVTHDDPNTNQGANLALWAEASWFPSILITDPRSRWEPVDENTALLYVPFETGEDNFVVRFNPQTGLIDMMEAMRYRNPGDQAKILWITQNIEGHRVEGLPVSAAGSALWLDQGRPWAEFFLEDIVYNVDVSEYIQRRGP